MRKALLAVTLCFLWAGAALSLPRAPQGQACIDPATGKEVRCQDGKYHDYYTGKEQPESCDNFKTGTSAVHDCDCAHATMKSGECDMPPEPGQKCKTECREHACKCQSMACS